jgi:hypothetical protein
MPLVENPVARLGGAMPNTGPERTHHIGHHRGGLPLTGRNSWIQMGGARLQQSLAHVGSNPASALDSCPMFLVHCLCPFSGVNRNA